MGWLALAGLTGLALWLVWRALPLPVTVPATGGDPYAGEIADFRRLLGDWCRG